MNADHLATVIKDLLQSDALNDYLTDHEELDGVIDEVPVAEIRHIGTRQVALLIKVDDGNGDEFQRFTLMISKEETIR